MTVSDVCTDGVNVYMADASGRLTKITRMVGFRLEESIIILKMEN